MAPPRPPRTKIKHFHGQTSEDIEAGLGKKSNSKEYDNTGCEVF